MPINAIILQPAANSLHAAYRPIMLRVIAQATDFFPLAPVVYCDIYINGIYYRTISKTHPTEYFPGMHSEWQFDIQDPLQEYLQKYLANNGHTTILEVSQPIALVFCRFRASGTSLDGFLVPEGTAPIQGTDETDPVAGNGTESNSFYVLNSSLQHEDNQDLAAHLDSFKHRTWDADTYPLTHRPDNYKICTNDSDSFPIVSNKVPARIVLHYLPVNSNVWQTSDYDLPCEPAAIEGSNDLPDGSLGVPYNVVKNLTGTAPFNIADVVKPAWMAINIVGSTLVFSGTPNVAALSEVSFNITNCIDESSAFDSTVSVNCVPVQRVNLAPLPNGVMNTPYSVIIPLTGSLPIVITPGSLVKPLWMNVAINGSQLELTGNPPNNATDVPVFIELTNCGGNVIIDETIDIAASGPYANLSDYSIEIESISGHCSVEVTITRTNAARDAAVADGKSVEVYYHVIANNGCETNGIFMLFAPADLTKTFVIDLVCGTGPCSDATPTLSSVIVL